MGPGGLPAARQDSAPREQQAREAWGVLMKEAEDRVCAGSRLHFLKTGGKDRMSVSKNASW